MEKVYYYQPDAYSLIYSNIQHESYYEWSPDNVTVEIANGKTAITVLLEVNGKFVLPVNATGLFRGFRGWRIENFQSGNIDVSQCTNMTEMFARCDHIQSFDVCNDWDVSRVTSFKGMFSECSLATWIDLSNWDTSSCTNMSWMFSGFGISGSSSFNFDLSNWNTSKVTDMSYMFYGANINSLNVSNFNTSKVTNFCAMFKNLPCTEIDVSHFDTSNADDIQWMFQGCTYLRSVDLSKWKTPKVRLMGWMFNGCASLKSVEVRQLKLPKIFDLQGLFSGCTSLEKMDLRDWDVSNAKYLSGMFEGCSNLVYVRVEGMKLATPGSYSPIITQMFYDCSSLQRVYAKPNTDWYIDGTAAIGGDVFTNCTKIFNWDGNVSAERANNVREHGYFGPWEGDWLDYNMFEKIDDNWEIVVAYQKDSEDWVPCEAVLKVL